MGIHAHMYTTCVSITRTPLDIQMPLTPHIHAKCPGGYPEKIAFCGRIVIQGGSNVGVSGHCKESFSDFFVVKIYFYIAQTNVLMGVCKPPNYALYTVYRKCSKYSTDPPGFPKSTPTNKDQIQCPYTHTFQTAILQNPAQTWRFFSGRGRGIRFEGRY